MISTAPLWYFHVLDIVFFSAQNRMKFVALIRKQFFKLDILRMDISTSGKM